MRFLILIFLFLGNIHAQEPNQKSKGAEEQEYVPQSSFKNYTNIFSNNEKAMAETMRTLREQLDLDQMFEGKEHLRGDPAQKPNGAEDMLNLSLSSFRLTNPRQLEQMILEQTKGGPIHSFLARDYKSLSYVVKVLQDPKALPYLGRIVDQRNKTYIFIGVIILTMIVLFIYKRKKFRGQSFFATLVPRFVIFLGALVFKMSVLILLFHKELTPLYKLTSSHF